MTAGWEDMTVAELRKYARDHGITLSAGINKQGIIERIAAASEQVTLADTAAPAKQQDTPAAEPAAEESKRPVRKASIISDDDDESNEIGYGMSSYSRPQSERPRYSSDPVRPAQPATPRGTEVLNSISSKAPAFHIDSGTKAWHNPRSFQPNNYHAPSSQGAQATHSYPQRPADAGRSPMPRTDTRSPAARTPGGAPQRFGPSESPRQAEPAPGARYDAPTEAVPNLPDASPYTSPYQNARTSAQPAALRDYQSLGKPSVNELLAQDESEDAEGSCVLLRNGAAYLYSDDCLDDEAIICLTAAQVRRFQLRTGDRVSGKIRSRRDGDKYRFMLYVTGINGIPADDVKTRASFGSLHVIVPSKRLMSLPLRTSEGERGESASVTLAQGQRVYARADGASPLQLAFALGKRLTEGKPGVRPMLLSLNDAPEEVAMVRAAAQWPVLAAEPSACLDKQCQVIRLAVSRLVRLTELKLDTVLMISCPDTPSAFEKELYAELLRAFSTGRAFKEGGSLSVILIGAEQADARFSRAASQTMALRPDNDQGVLALDGSVETRAYQIIV